MSYPNSSDVSAGDATLASQYNNLRSDALYMGQLAADAVTLGQLLARYESNLNIERFGTDRLRLVCTEDDPVALVVDGYMVRVASDLYLAVGDEPVGAASTFYIFANRADDSTSFTLSVSTSPTEVNNRRIGRFYWNGSAIVKDSVRTELSVLTADRLYLVNPTICEGRLTLSTGVPVPTADIASSANLYFTPHTGSRIALYVPGYGWRLYAFSELSASVAAVAADVNLDVFIYNNDGTLTLELLQWSNATLRATALTRQDGVLVKSGDATRRYLGTVRTSAAGVTCDTKLKRFVWNYYNRIERSLLVTDPTASWTYAEVKIWRSLNNNDANRVQFVIGVDETLVKFTCSCLAENSADYDVIVSIALDATDQHDENILRGGYRIAGADNFLFYGADYFDRPGEGFHFLQIVEYSTNGTSTFYGYDGTDPCVTAGGIGSLVC